ncbi:sodium/potassium-transporting ATPase subunit beta-2-like [Lycorma delicatula]|uniref:sodium/potassium-transporting ATPase subunit beta-2-like n=1 Tax=Lycorma delicatula TaxID=130591 RepID=UPI003F5105B1
MTSSKQQEAMLGNQFFKPPVEPATVKFKKFLFNPETGAFLGRTGSNWGKLSAFYIIFYCCLATLFAILLWLFFLTLDPRIPKWKLDQSLIGTNPGLGYRPMPDSKNVLSSLIWYKGTNEEDFKYWKDSIEEFLDAYRRPGSTPGRGQNTFKCDYDRFPGPGQVCEIDAQGWYPCVKENHYNYHQQGPCIFIKLNKIYGWRPEFYNDTNDLPEKMPQTLKNYIYEQANISLASLNTVWVSCEGENPADVEHIGSVKYEPRQGFPGYFFPYENSEGYLSPLVAVIFERPKTGILINVECKAWAKNIKHDRRDKTGLVHFELMID